MAILKLVAKKKFDVKKFPKKYLLIPAGVVAVLLIGSFIFGGPPGAEKPPADPEARKEWVAEKIIDSLYNHQTINLNYKVPSQKELDRLKTQVSLKRVYPPFMNAVMEYGTDVYTANLLYFGDELQELGLNTIVLLPGYHVKNGQLQFFYSNTSGSPMLLSASEAKRAIAHSIIMAKQLGFTVILIPDYPDLEQGGFSQLKNPDQFEAELERVILELAEIAEEYGVEYLAPSNAMEMLMVENNYQRDEIYRRTNAYNARVTPKLRKIYSGKIFYKMGGLGDWPSYKNISLEGADLFGFTGCYYHEPWFIADDIKQAAQVADAMSARDGVPWMNIEFFVRNEQDQLRDLGEIKVTTPIEEAYQVGLASFKENAGNAVGFTITSYLGAGKIRGTKAQPLVKEFFTSKL